MRLFLLFVGITLLGAVSGVSAQQPGMRELVIDGYYQGIDPATVEAWRTIQPIERAFAGSDYWRAGSQTGPIVRVWYNRAVAIDPDPTGRPAYAYLITGITDRPGVLLVTVAYRALDWHCRDAFFVQETDWSNANAQYHD